MSMSHHGEPQEQNLSPDQLNLIERFNEQITREYRRAFPRGRIAADDDGDLTYAITADPKHGIILIRFAHPTEWIGLRAEEAEQLRDAIDERLLELRGIKP